MYLGLLNKLEPEWRFFSARHVVAPALISLPLFCPSVSLQNKRPCAQQHIVKISEAFWEAIRRKPTFHSKSLAMGIKQGQSLGWSHLKEAHQGLCLPNITALKSIFNLRYISIRRKVVWAQSCFVCSPGDRYSGRHGPNVQVPPEAACVCLSACM